jgi:hypothetical protein
MPDPSRQPLQQMGLLAGGDFDRVGRFRHEHAVSPDGVHCRRRRSGAHAASARIAPSTRFPPRAAPCRHEENGRGDSAAQLAKRRAATRDQGRHPQPGRDRLRPHGRQLLAQGAANRPVAQHAGLQSRVCRQQRLDRCEPCPGEPPVDVGLQVVFAHGPRSPAHFTLRKVMRSPPSIKRRSWARARLSRDMMVPSGTLNTAAASA